MKVRPYTPLSDKNNIWLNNFVPMVQDWRKTKGTDIKALDVGCNMGILVEGANNEGFDVRGIDINRLSIEVGKKEFPKIADKLSVDDFTQPQSEENVYDVVVLSDVLSHVGSPMNLLNNTLQVLKEDGVFYVNVVNWGCKKAQEEFHRWDGVGVGENITVYDRDSFSKLADLIGIDYEDYRTDEEDEMMFLRCQRRK